jgi:Cu+-exporting ATPase
VQHSTDDQHDHATPGGRSAGSAIDPVCGMAVDPEAARAKGLHSTYAGRGFWFCGRGCKLDFDEDPEHYLDPSYRPSM